MLLIGIWNERDSPLENAYIKQLDGAGYFNTRIVAKDTTWDVTTDKVQDPELMTAIDDAGVH